MTFDVGHVDLQIMITVFLDNFAGEVSAGCCQLLGGGAAKICEQGIFPRSSAACENPSWLWEESAVSMICP